MDDRYSVLQDRSGWSDPGLPAPFDDRGAPRVTLLLRTAKLLVESREFLCIVRDVSETGIRLELFHPLPTEGEILLEVRNGDRYPISLIWSDGRFAGFSFDEPIDLVRFLAAPRANLPERQIRLNSSMLGTITFDSQTSRITFENISQQGACIECDKFIAVDQMVAIEAARIPFLQAKVRWRRQPRYGLIFEQPFRFEDLARRLAP